MQALKICATCWWIAKFKRLFWIDARSYFQFSNILPDKVSIWYALHTSRSNQNQQPLADSTLLAALLQSYGDIIGVAL